MVVGGYDGHVHVLNVSDRGEPEHHRIRLSPQTTDAVYATPLVLNSACIVATTAGQLWWIDRGNAHMLG